MTNKQPEPLRLAEILEGEHAQPEALRLAKYVARRKLAKQLDVNEIHGFDSGCDTEAVLLLSDIDAVLAQVAALTAAQSAAPQGGAYAALPDADRDYMRKVVAVAVTMLFDGYKEDVTRVFSTGELSEFVTITAAMGGERVEDIYRRAWDLLSLPVRASHGQAPAQAASVEVADAVADSQYLAGVSAGWNAANADNPNEALRKLHESRAGYLKPLHAARAPADSVTAPAGAGVAHALSDGQIEAMPVWRNFVGLWPESRREIVDAVVDLLTTPPTQAADSVLEDAARLDWLLLHISGAEFRRIGVHYSGNARRADVDAARKQGANHD